MTDEGQQKYHCPDGPQIDGSSSGEMLRMHLLQEAVCALEHSSLAMLLALFREKQITCHSRGGEIGFDPHTLSLP
jgi:hypothetical protein